MSTNKVFSIWRKKTVIIELICIDDIFKFHNFLNHSSELDIRKDSMQSFSSKILIRDSQNYETWSLHLQVIEINISNSKHTCVC